MKSNYLYNPRKRSSIHKNSTPAKTSNDPTIHLYKKENHRVSNGASASGRDMSNRLPQGGRTGHKKSDKLMGYKSPPMY